MNERIEFNNILKVADIEGLIHLLINIKFKVIVEDPGSPTRNIPHSPCLILCKTNIIYPKYNK